MARRRRRQPDLSILFRRRRRWGRWLLGVIGAILLAVLAGERLGSPAQQGPDSERFDGKRYFVERIVDGDTVRIRPLDGGESTPVRLIGIDAPEMRPQGKSEPDHWAERSTAFLRELAEGRTVIVRLEPREQRDRYGRLLAYLYLNESEMLNLIMVREGHAYADRRFRHSHRRQFEQAEDQARRRDRGLWRDVKTEQMPAWRQRWLAEQN